MAKRQGLIGRLRDGMVTLLAAMLALWLPLAAHAAERVTLALVPASERVAAGATVEVAVVIRPAAGWHGYWRYAGEVGYPPRLAWTGAEVAGETRYPVPSLVSVSGIASHVLKGEHALIVPLRLPTGLRNGDRANIAVEADMLVCTDTLCVPARARAATAVTVGQGGGPVPAFDRWRARLPMSLDRPATFTRQGERLSIAVPLPASASVRDARFFPDAAGMIREAAPQSARRSGDLLIVDTQGGAGAPSGVLALGDGRGLMFRAVPGAVPEGGTPVGEGGTGPAALWAILGAIAGGLILNLMPCVFPILSLKALHLARAGGDERAVRREALAYTAGAVAVTTALGAAVLALRAGGEAAGWAFQLQQPGVIVTLLVLTGVIALNLAGLFELPSLGGRAEAAGGFATGALAAFIATPCTGPFMGVALGAALLLPSLAALAVFAGLGLGLALPFLAVGFVPALRARLPKPGPWLGRVRAVLSLPMFLTALGLAWLLGRQAGSDGMAWGLAALLAAGLALWWAGARQRRGLAGLAVASVIAVLATAGAASQLRRAEAVASVRADSFSEARLAALRAEGAPVFVYFTADWCLTCKVNERGAIDRAEVQAAFARAGIRTLVGDWTNGDATIGRFLAQHGRSGVPLYLFYPKGGAAPVELPQILTPGALTALAK